jgi:hypothetical protein
VNARTIEVLRRLADGSLDAHGKDRRHVIAALRHLSRYRCVALGLVGGVIVTARVTPLGEKVLAHVAKAATITA